MPVAMQAVGHLGSSPGLQQGLAGQNGECTAAAGTLHGSGDWLELPHTPTLPSPACRLPVQLQHAMVQATAAQQASAAAAMAQETQAGAGSPAGAAAASHLGQGPLSCGSQALPPVVQLSLGAACITEADKSSGTPTPLAAPCTDATQRASMGSLDSATEACPTLQRSMCTSGPAAVPEAAQPESVPGMLPACQSSTTAEAWLQPGATESNAGHKEPHLNAAVAAVRAWLQSGGAQVPSAEEASEALQPSRLDDWAWLHFEGLPLGPVLLPTLRLQLAGLACGLLTPGMPCLLPSVLRPAVATAAGADSYGALRMSLALLDLQAAWRQRLGAPAAASDEARPPAVKQGGEHAPAGVVESLLMHMAMCSISRIAAPMQQQAIQHAVQDCIHLRR